MCRFWIVLLSCVHLSQMALASEAETRASEKPSASATVEFPPLAAPISLRAKGPGARFSSVEAAAVDALIYAYLHARADCETEFMRGGTIFPIGEQHFSYSEIQRAQASSRNKISYVLKPRDVARFHVYPIAREAATNRINEKASPVDLRSVASVDPLHRPLFILHPSLVIRTYAGGSADASEVANLRTGRSSLRMAGQCTHEPTATRDANDSNRIAETSPPFPRYEP